MSKIEVNQISSQCGSTLTIGQSGDTVTLACGATQTGFGRTGTVDWCTTAKTAPFTGVSGKGYFVNTTCGAVTVTLPATPTAGDIISIADYASTFQTNNLSICNNGSLINGVCATAALNTQGQSITLVYVDGTRGWKNTMDSTSNVTAASFITATGGTITTCGDYKIHTFTSDGCFAVTTSAIPANNVVSYVVVAGGGGGAGNPGAADGSSGGGAGGFREGKVSSDPYTASPLALTPCSALPVTSTTYPITVGAGGTPGPASFYGGQGGPSIFSSITSAGGGGGQYPAPPYAPPTAKDGGSGAGAAASGNPLANQIGLGNTPPTSPSQGNNGGNYASSGASAAGGGGGAGAVGGSAPSNVVAGSGGAGVSTSITGSSVTRGGGGGGSSYPVGTGGDGGSGGGGAGGISPTNPTPVGISGTTNTGGGGGGANGNPGNPGSGGAGGSGIVMIRYKYQ
jgi:hypothetical protein